MWIYGIVLLILSICFFIYYYFKLIKKVYKHLEILTLNYSNAALEYIRTKRLEEINKIDKPKKSLDEEFKEKFNKLLSIFSKKK